MEQLKNAERSELSNVELARFLIQRLIGWGVQSPLPASSNTELFDERDLAQRVRQSGEW
jgi:hypothetical protein